MKRIKYSFKDFMSGLLIVGPLIGYAIGDSYINKIMKLFRKCLGENLTKEQGNAIIALGEVTWYLRFFFALLFFVFFAYIYLLYYRYKDRQEFIGEKR